MKAVGNRALVVGADRIEGVREALMQAAHLGVTCTEHWSGRRVGDTRRAIPGDTRLVVVLCDRINHDLLYSVRRQAASRGLQVVYCRHSVIDMRDKLARFALADEGACLVADCPAQRPAAAKRSARGDRKARRLSA